MIYKLPTNNYESLRTCNYLLMTDKKHKILWSRPKKTQDCIKKTATTPFGRRAEAKPKTRQAWEVGSFLPLFLGQKFSFSLEKVRKNEENYIPLKNMNIYICVFNLNVVFNTFSVKNCVFFHNDHKILCFGKKQPMKNGKNALKNPKNYTRSLIGFFLEKPQDVVFWQGDEL